jgi:hypothetical protein
MPSDRGQRALPGTRTNPELVAARFLLKPGRKYEDTVEAFEPHDRIQEVNEEAGNAVRADYRRRALRAATRRLTFM